MKQITEDYVSFETAKLLKEKGFPQNPQICNTVYKSDGTFCINAKSFWNPYVGILLGREYYMAPTLQMAMKWLREVHKLVVCAEIGNENLKGNTDYSNPDRWYWFFDITNEKGVVIDLEAAFTFNEYSTYEQACEAAIMYCLENLIVK